MYTSILEYVNSQEYKVSHNTNIESIQEAKSKTPLRENKHIKVKLPDVEDFIKKNNVKEITNPIFFIRDGVPSPDGLLSNEIFGITKEERANIWGYIDLQGTYLHPLIYKIWGRMDRSIKNIVHGLKGYKIDSDGYIVEDLENGETGLDFLVKNINKIKIKETKSRERLNNIEFIMKNKNRMFIKKMLVQPPFYRDVLSNKGKVEVGQINKYYSSLLIFAKSLRETQDMGFSLGDATKGRIQDVLLSIYKCVTGTSDVPEDGTGLAGKTGIIRTSGLSKTVDYGTRLVLSAPELKVETLDDLMVDLDHCSLPLSSAVINFKPFVIFQVKRFFDNEFGNGTGNTVLLNGKPVYANVKDPQLVFSDEKIELQLKKFVYSFSNRLEPVKVPIEVDGKIQEVFLTFKGRSITLDQYAKGETPTESDVITRPLTWCDIFFIATNEAIQDKCVLVTRYPINFCRLG